MKKILMLIFVLNAFAIGVCQADSCIKVNVMDFDAQLFVPINEATMRIKKFKQYSIDGNYISGMISGFEKENYDYEPDNVRAYFSYQGREYFIDQKGIVRSGKLYKVLDVLAFEKQLVAACKSDK